jgi:hypothetical protein
MSVDTSVRVGGWSLILGAIAFMAVFSFLAARFDYPRILDGEAATVLPRLLATGRRVDSSGRCTHSCRSSGYPREWARTSRSGARTRGARSSRSNAPWWRR